MRTRGTSSKRIHVSVPSLSSVITVDNQGDILHLRRHLIILLAILLHLILRPTAPCRSTFVALVFFELVVLLNRADDIPFWSVSIPRPTVRLSSRSPLGATTPWAMDIILGRVR
ncbi:hypothetical protein PAPYR_9416 [Paratrimastix pyriformis]|uniref:Uncharacterized protein n=1 Tax=Paratrimastix pyriformis TaxID=342808 RepID=A0ABQ8U8H7_9EUKA|nr:hypothetical protein PAPYR_9416 [Paratrimastix pyriformis]